jgi:DegV family protein with EDD domain
MTNHTTALITDSTCDIPDELLAQYDIPVVPCSIIWGEQILRDRIDITAVEFYRRLDASPVLPKTSNPSPELFRLALEAAAAQGAREAVVITVSSALSGTYNSALMGAQGAGLPVTVVDSKGVTLSLGWQVLAAAGARASGGDAQAMTAAANSARQAMALWISLDTLEYLQKGGRIGNATRLIGTLLSIKPLIYVDHGSGLVEAGPLVRSRRKSIDAMVDHFFGQVGSAGSLRIAVLHGGAREEAEELAERIRRERNPRELILTTTCPVLGVHTGPRTLALCGYVV